ncbi:ribonuclease HII [Virgibacillus oceani]|uniref:Ribonuclease HII n=1 Tax=Virgibacillus oceani TaxID=1479511 RepID=A0A917M045_9BACI|nr:ribonuclease HII [Virgibacillus oceani]GGG69134.1 ribonuclease HII [Virgibacillus oceani]
MKNKSIAALKQLFVSGDINDNYVNELKSDERKGVQALIKSYESKKRKELELNKKFINMSNYEQKGYQNGCNHIAGIDEAGRGPLAGPVVAAAVILPRDFKLLGLDDSKQLNEATRNKFFDIIKRDAVSYGISIISNQKIDALNIFEATKLAMRDCLNQLDPQPDHVLIDAVQLDRLSCTHEAITKGDQKSISIAAASILAKVTRDRIMKDIHSKFPAYDFSSNMGYGTKHHMDMLSQHGITPYHRRSFAPVRNAAK